LELKELEKKKEIVKKQEDLDPGCVKKRVRCPFLMVCGLAHVWESFVIEL